MDGIQPLFEVNDLFVIGGQDAAHRGLAAGFLAHDGTEAQGLVVDQRREGDHRHDAEGQGKDFRLAVEGDAGADGHRQDETRGERTAGHTARVEGDGRVELRYEERQAQREEIARNQVVQQREVEDDPDDGKTDRDADADGKGGHHLPAGDLAVGDFLHLLVEYVDGRLGHDHHETDDEADDGQQRLVEGGQLDADLVADGHEADGDGRQEDYQSEEGEQKPDGDRDQLFAGQLEDGGLEDQEEQDDQQQGLAYVDHRLPEDTSDAGFQDGVHGVVGDIVGQGSFRKEGKQQHGDDRTDGAEGDQAETVLIGVAPAHGQGDTDGLNYTFTQDDKLVTGGDFLIKNLKTNKVTVIQQEIGVQPVLSFGNSSGDASMANFTIANNKYKSAAFMLCCDDTERENGNVEKAESMRKSCEENGWTAVSMKNDWTTIYGDGVTYNGNVES